MVSFCEEADVRRALQKVSLSGATGSEFVSDAIEDVSGWFARATNGHWYDSGGTLSAPVDSSVATASNVRLDVPSSPHRQDRQLFSDHQGARYPRTTHGPYAAIPLPHLYVETINTLEVRDLGGGVDDWVADSDFVEGRGEDYYVQAKGQNSYGRTYLYIRAASIGARTDYAGLLTLDYDYGLDYDDEAWDDVKRGIASMAAAEVVDEDSVIAQVPESGTLVGLDTQHTNLVDAAMRSLGPYLSAMASNE